jgi:hypothetical protein
MRTTTCKTARSIFGIRGQRAHSDTVVEGVRWLCHVAGNMGAEALAHADHPLKVEIPTLLSKNLRV